MSPIAVSVTDGAVSCALEPLAVTRPAPGSTGMLYEWVAHIAVDVERLSRDGKIAELRGRMLKIFERALDEYERHAIPVGGVRET